MRSRKEQLQAYQFLRRRIGAALLAGEPDTLDPPMRRVVRTSFAGLMVGVIIIAVFGVYGLLRPGGAQGWKVEDGALVVEKETGSSYVYHNGELHPMLNYASARLFLGQGGAEPFRVSRRSLEGTSRAPEKGIPDAPHSLPDPDGLIVSPWSVCATPNDSSASTVTLLAGVQPSGGRLRDNEALIVSAGGMTYLVWRNQRFRVPDPSILLPMGLGDITAQEVGAAWLNALDPGPDLTYPEIPRLGQPGPQLPNGSSSRVGEIFVVDYTDRQEYLLVMPDGLALISPTQAQIIRSSPQVEEAFGSLQFQPMGASEVPRATLTDAPEDLAGYPSGIQSAANAEDPEQRGVLCVTLSGTSGGGLEPTVSAVGVVPHEGEPLAPPPGSTQPVADAFFVEPGRGAVVAAMPVPGLPENLRPKASFLVTDRGIKYPIANDGKSLEALGYSAEDVAYLPSTFLSMLPSGPALSQRAAAQVTGNAPQPAIQSSTGDET